MDYPVPGDDVPTYVVDSNDDLEAWTTGLQDRAAELHLPVTTSPRDIYPARTVPAIDIPTLDPEVRALHRRLVRTLFDAVQDKNTELVTLLVSGGLVSPDCTNGLGETPLIVAVACGNGAMVCHLVGLGAQVNRFSELPPIVRGRIDPYKERGWLDRRTPVMTAAQNGNLALVKLLVDDFGADDALVAPDGQLALRLAADAGHREVVAFLPARRGGAFRRWKLHHARAWSRIKTASASIVSFFKWVLWIIPRAILWDLPAYFIVFPLRDGLVWTWKHRALFPAWCKNQARRVGRGVRRIPSYLKAAAVRTWNGVKKIPKMAKDAAAWTWDVIKAIPQAVKDVLEWLWGFIKAIPRAIKIAAMWVWQSLKKMGEAVGDVMLQLLSLLHTTIMAVVGFFRSITLKDVWNGLCSLLQTVFVKFPQAVWSAIRAFGEASYKFMGTLFGVFGEVVWWVVRGLLWVVNYVPWQIWEILAGLGSSVAKGYKEFMVWLNPKR